MPPALPSADLTIRRTLQHPVGHSRRVTSSSASNADGRTAKGTYARSWVLAGHARRAHLALLVVLSLLASLFESLGAALIVLVLSLATDKTGAIDLPLVGDVSAYLPGDTQSAHTAWAAGALAVFFLLRAGVMIGQTYAQHRVLHRAGARLSVALLDGYMRKPYAFHLERKSAELIRNTFNGVQTFVTSVLIPAITLLTDGLVVTVLLSFMFFTAPQATALALALVTPVIVLLLRFVQPRLKTLGKITQEDAQRSFQILQQTMTGAREIKLHQRESFFTRAYSKTRMRAARAQYIKGSALALPRTTIETTLVLLMLSFVVVTAVTGASQSATIPIVGLFAYVGFRLQPSLQRIVMALNNIRFAGPAVDHLYDDYITMEHRAAAPALAPVDRPELRTVRLRSVWFSYKGDDRYALSGVDLEASRGESIGICGPSGSGKSTLIDVVCGLLSPTHGRVEANGVDIADDYAGWYSRIGLVSQSIYMFDGTIRSNIAFGVPEHEIDEERVREAAEHAQLGEMLAALPDGLDTEVGERGLAVSGGQRQRIAIARALYLRPELLVFDEGTSALDNTTEAALIRAIERLRGERIIITVAHRLSTVRRCDRVIYLSDGDITAEGTYDELLERHAGFSTMAAARE